MKRETKLEKKVMESVVSFEKKRSVSWAAVFVLVGLILVALIIGAFWVSASIIAEQKSLDMFSLLTEDPEIIAEYWRDALFVLWEELPTAELLLFILALIVFIFLAIVTRKRRAVLVKRLTQVFYRP